MFADESVHPVDPKGRVFVPKRFHPFIPFNEEGARVVMLTAGMDGCLFLFTEKGHAAELSRLDVGTFAGREARAMQRMLFRFTSRTNLDASGRLLIPERYREMAGIGDEVAVIGVGARIEIWAPDRLKRFFEESPATLEALSDTGGVGLAPAPGGGSSPV
jgi:MraZ protein